MNQSSMLPYENTLDVLLADIAIRVQLSPTQFRTAEARYQAIAKWADRPSGPLSGRVLLVYTQGGMAIGATIASAAKNDEFDIDLIAQLNVPTNITPFDALNLTYQAIRGEPGSRYFGKTTRNTRCVTVHYSDMHLDITPAVLIPGLLPRTSTIFHSKLEEPRHRDQRIIANPYGFSQWFNQQTPAEAAFGDYYARRSTEWDRRQAFRADAEDVPEPSPAHHKAIAVVALQLLKRFRNLRYDRRETRSPPSVLLAKMIAESTSGSQQISIELIYQAKKILERLQNCLTSDQLLHEVNPTCIDDVLTDRWPATVFDQRLFAEDLQYLSEKLQRLQAGIALDEIRDILSDLFGETPAQDVISRLNDQIGFGVDTRVAAHQPRTGKIALASVIPSAPAVQTGSAARSSQTHTFYGRAPQT